MKLYLNKASPYARLVMVVAFEKALDDSIELVWTDPWSSAQPLLSVNPFSKVPALILDDGQALLDSACICEYLDMAGGGRRLLPATGAARVSALRKYGFGRTLIDSAFGVVIERRFSATDALAARWLAAVGRGIETLERRDDLLDMNTDPDIGDLVIAVGLSYTDFRLSEIGWRATAPRTSDWLSRLAARPSMARTAPE